MANEVVEGLEATCCWICRDVDWCGTSAAVPDFPEAGPCGGTVNAIRDVRKFWQLTVDTN